MDSITTADSASSHKFEGCSVFITQPSSYHIAYVELVVKMRLMLLHSIVADLVAVQT